MKRSSFRFAWSALVSCFFVFTISHACLGQLGQGEARLTVVQVAISGTQRFSCSKGYSQSECRSQISSLQQLLRQYRADELGEWDWVLVRAEEWKPLLRQLGLSPVSPAITDIGERETLLDEALLSPNAARSAELLQTFQIPLDRMLALAVSHELGHALCREMDEARADLFGEQIRRGTHPACRPSH